MSSEDGRRSSGHSGATAALADWVAGLSMSALPAEVKLHTRTLMADHLRSLVLGAATPWSTAIGRVGRRRGAAGPCAVADAGPSLDPATAAFINGCFAHGADLDDTHIGAMLHPGAAVVPAVAALAQARESSGAEMLLALVAGYEAAVRIGEAMQPEHYQQGFQATGTCGALGAAVGASKLLGHGSAEIQSAIGLAGSMAAGLARFYYAGGDAKRIHAGRAAEAGVLAADMVSEGLHGPSGTLEGTGGFGPAYSSRFDESAITDALGDGYRFLDVIVKKHATSARLQLAVDMTQNVIRDGELAVDAIDQIQADVPELMRGRLTNIAPRDVTAAQMSLPFTISLAATIVESGSPAKALRVGHYVDGMQDPEVRRLAERFTFAFRQPVGEPTDHAVKLTFHQEDRRPVDISVSRPQRRGGAELWDEVTKRVASLSPHAPDEARRLLKRLAKLESDASGHALPGELLKVLLTTRKAS